MNRKHFDNSVNVPDIAAISTAQELRKTEWNKTQRKSLKKNSQARKKLKVSLYKKDSLVVISLFIFQQPIVKDHSVQTIFCTVETAQRKHTNNSVFKILAHWIGRQVIMSLSQCCGGPTGDKYYGEEVSKEDKRHVVLNQVCRKGTEN